MTNTCGNSFTYGTGPSFPSTPHNMKGSIFMDPYFHESLAMRPKALEIVHQLPNWLLAIMGAKIRSKLTVAIADAMARARPDGLPDMGESFYIGHDGFEGDVIGYYVRRDGKRGVVLQQEGTCVVHVYGEKWILGQMQDPNGN